MILANVTSLSSLREDSLAQLKNTIIHWARSHVNVGLGRGLLHNIIMAKRVAWISRSQKSFKDNCIVNFNNSYTAGQILSDLNQINMTNSDIIPLPLGFFYRPIQMGKQAVHCKREGYIQPKANFNVNSLDTLPTANRFPAFSSLDHID